MALRAGFVMEQVLGHVSHYRTLRAVLDDEPGTRLRVAQGRLRAEAFTWRQAATELWRLHTRFFEMASAR